MSTKAIVLAAGALCAAVAGLVSPTLAAGYLINPGLDAPGPLGAGPITTTRTATGPVAFSDSAAAGWFQFTVWPTGFLTTTLETTTDPLGSGDMLHIVTDSGENPPDEMGNGWGQLYTGGVILTNATLTFDLNVVSGEVSGGLTKTYPGGGIGVFPPGAPSWGPTGGWIPVTEHFNTYLSPAVIFETLTYGTTTGANYYVDNLEVAGSAVPELETWAMILFGFAGLGLVGGRASLKSGLAE